MTADSETYEQIETVRLVLEPIDESHAPLLFPLLTDQRLYDYIEERPPAVVEVLKKRYRTWRSFWNENPDEQWFNWAARLRGVNEYVGWFQATLRPEYALIAYMVFVPYQGRGFAREGCEAVMTHLATTYRKQRIRATIDPRNVASIAVARSLGMTGVPNDTPDLWFEREVEPNRV